MTTRKAAVMHAPGGPEVLKIESLTILTPKSGEVLIRVKSFGLNRSEMFTLQGYSLGIAFRAFSASKPPGLSKKPRRRVSQTAISRNCKGWHGAAVQRRLCRIYSRTCKPSAIVKTELA